MLLQIYQNLSTADNMNVYKKQEIPDRYHYKNGRFVSTLTLVAEPGWFITEVSEAILHTICPQCPCLSWCFMTGTIQPDLDVDMDAIMSLMCAYLCCSNSQCHRATFTICSSRMWNFPHHLICCFVHSQKDLWQSCFSLAHKVPFCPKTTVFLMCAGLI